MARVARFGSGRKGRWEVRALLARRVRAHPAALVAVTASVLVSMLVVATLQLLASGIARASVRAELGVPAGDRGVVVSAGVHPGELAAADARVRAAVAGAGDGTLTRSSTATTRGLVGGAPTDRVLLSDLDGLQGRARLVAGAWPETPAGGVRPGAGPVEAVVPENVARALDISVGDRLALTDLIAPGGPPITVVVAGVFAPTGVEQGLWADDPLGLRGVSRTDFTTFGPVVVPEGAFDSGLVDSATVVWRWTPQLEGVDGAQLGPLGRRLDVVIERLRRVAGVGIVPSTREAERPLRNGQVATALPGIVERAVVSEARVRAALLAPTVLLVVLGASSLVVAAALLAALRNPETRLLRTRGASTARLGALSLVDALAVVLLGSVASLLAAPVLAGTVARGAGLPAAELSTASSFGGLPWASVLVMGALAVVVVVTTTLRVGRAGDGARGGRGAAKLLRALGSSGLDVALVGLSVLGVIQLRRYDSTGSAVADPLTVAAPALVVVGSAVLCLRLLPVLSGQVARLTDSHRGLPVAWGGWQLSRRLASQSGTVLLVLLAVAMGALALSHSSTAQRAAEDQSAYETGGTVRVVTGALGGDGPASVGSALAAASGGSRVTPVYRESVDLGPVTGITVLALDAASAAGVVDPRPDTLGDLGWRQVTERLTARRVALDAPTIPDGARTLTLRVRLTASASIAPGYDIASSVVLRDGTGLLTVLPLGPVRAGASDLTVDLPAARGGPWQLLGVLGTPGGPVLTGGGSLPPGVVPGSTPGQLQIVLQAARAASTPLEGLQRLADRSTSDTVLTAVLAGRIDAVPAVVTQGVAEAAKAGVGKQLEVLVGGRRVPIEVVGVVGSVPTAADPHRAVLLDLPTLLVTGDPPTADRRLSTRVLEPAEWWLAPQRAVDGDALRRVLPNGSTIEVRSAIVAERLDNPVNAGMRAAMLLVTGAALVLAAVGFGATTAALGRERRRENAVLLALGMPPGRIRRTLEAERAAVVFLTVLVGLVLGVLSALTVVPVLVGGDGHRQVPDVVVALPWPALLVFAAVVAGVLAAVGVLVLRRVGSDVAAELRRGES